MNIDEEERTKHGTQKRKFRGSSMSRKKLNDSLSGT